MKPQRHGLLPALSEKRQKGHLILYPLAIDRAATERRGKLVRTSAGPASVR